ncbi:MAG: SDR family oxidoreductase [Deltaproteobacteria bacterium]|jgi:NAD(P)-dependent dehydrogenase (short-subunit alcohol dehydrogenase family)|nr:SDR family oxidoreductase [Deltaproteobacteria bacterium]
MTSSRFSLSGKRVLLTGAGGGIGAALLSAFLEEGALAAGAYRTTPDFFAGLKKKYAHSFFPLQCDLSREAEVETLPDRAEEALGGGVEVAVHNAWIVPYTQPYSLENLRVVSAVGLEAAYILYGSLAPRMAARGQGSIISIASINGLQAFPGNPAYTSVKGALRLFTKTVARDFGGQGVRANNLCPGYVHTRMTAASHADPVRHEERRDRTMLGRWAVPDDMVGPCLFLASDASAYVTGIDLIVDGGWIAKGL